jgi:hypothetical protein
MESGFIGRDRLILYRKYSRDDLGLKGTQQPVLHFWGKHEQAVFINLGEQYDDRITRYGILFQPRTDFTFLTIIDGKPEKIDTYLFVRMGKSGEYYYLGISNQIGKYDECHVLFDMDTSGIPDEVIRNLGGFQPF